MNLDVMLPNGYHIIAEKITGISHHYSFLLIFLAEAIILQSEDLETTVLQYVL